MDQSNRFHQKALAIEWWLATLIVGGSILRGIAKGFPELVPAIIFAVWAIALRFWTRGSRGRELTMKLSQQEKRAIIERAFGVFATLLVAALIAWPIFGLLSAR